MLSLVGCDIKKQGLNLKPCFNQTHKKLADEQYVEQILGNT